MWLAIGVLVVIALLVCIHQYGSSPVVHRKDAGHLGELITALYRRGYNGGLAVVRDGGKQRFLRLNKYILRGGRLGLNLYLPTPLWTAEENERLQELMSRHGIQFGSAHLNEPGSLVLFPLKLYNSQRATVINHSQMSVIDCGDDLSGCIALVEEIFSQVLNQPRDSGYLVELWGASLKDELITSTDSGSP